MIIYPFNTENFKDYWNLWKQYKRQEFRFKYKSEISEQAALKHLSNLAQSEHEAIEIIEQSFANGWKGFFKLNRNLQNNGQTNNKKGVARERLAQIISNQFD